MLENLFLSYANNPFHEDPENLNKVFFEIWPSPTKLSFTPPYKDLRTKHIVDMIITFARQNDLKTALKYYEKSKKEGLSDIMFDIAFEAVYRHRDGYCSDGCIDDYSYGRTFVEISDEFKAKHKRRPHCLECRQQFFIKVLNEIVEGKSYRDIVFCQTYDERQEELSHIISQKKLIPDEVPSEPKLNFIQPPEPSSDKQMRGFGLQDYFNGAYDSIKSSVVLTEKGKLGQLDHLDFENLHSETSPYNLETRFDDFLTGLVGYSLSNFLINKDRRKLKRCDYCKKFTIAYRIKKENAEHNFCSGTSCKDLFHRAKRKDSKYHTLYMRDYQR